MRWPTAAALTVALLGHAAAALAFPWDKDMVDQQSVKPQEAPVPAAPLAAVPVSGAETLPAPDTEQGMFDAKEAAAELPNPVAATSESLGRGRALYEMNCLPCHGNTGRGDGPVGLLFDPSPADLTDEYTQAQADGQIFFTLTRGRGAMPFYRDSLSQEERWHVINYLKTEFGAR
jgi:mono/diheme cytochrome c family protein